MPKLRPMSQTLLKKASRYLSSRTTRYTEGIANPDEPPTPTEERECRTITTFPKSTAHSARVRMLALARPKSRLLRKRGSAFPRVAPMSTHTRPKRPAARANRARHALRFPPIHARRAPMRPPSSACRQAEGPSTPTLGAPMRPPSDARLATKHPLPKHQRRGPQKPYSPLRARALHSHSSCSASCIGKTPDPSTSR